MYNGLAMAMPDYQPDRPEDQLPAMPQLGENPLPPKRTDFSFHVFFLVFWLTLIATVLISWQMVVVQL